MNQNSKPLLPVIIISATIILSLAILSRTGIYIKNIGGVDSNGKISNSISVTGDGKVFARPDMVQVTVGFRELGSTSRQALDRVNQKINQAQKIIKDNNIPDSDVVTDNFYIFTEYDYSGDSKRILGQRASQSLTVKIKKIDDKATKAAKIIDELSSIDNAQISGIEFDIEDKTKLFTEARVQAFNKAKQKAEELAGLSKVKLLKPISISDTTYDISYPRYSNVAEMKSSIPVSGGGDSSQISTGEMSVSASLSILWGME